MTPDEHLSWAAQYLDQAQAMGGELYEQSGSVSALALLSQAHTLLAGELVAQSTADTLTAPHRCYPPGEQLTTDPSEWVCVCGRTWSLATVTAGHLTWTTQAIVRRPT